MKKLKIKDTIINVNYYEGFSDKATITVPLGESQDLSFADIVQIFKDEDISTLAFYEVNNDNTEMELEGELEGYTKVVGYTSNLESQMGTINLAKPNVNNMSLEELKALIDARLASVTNL